MAKTIEANVEKIVEEIRNGESARFSKTDFQILVYGILADKNFKAKKYLLKKDGIQEEETSYCEAIRKFLDKLLKHAGIAESAEREAILDSFDYSYKDMEWIIDCVDEAMAIYTDCGKNMRMFRDKMLQLTIRKIKRTGAHEGKWTYKKTVMDRMAKMKK